VNLNSVKINQKAYLGQTHSIKKLETTYGDLVKAMQNYKTPGTPNVGIVRANI
jgi:hypothetical protein